MSERYRKQFMVPEIGAAGQKRIGAASVLVIGAGGLGCAVLPYLTGAGVGRITVVDDDRVDRSNLQRQVLFGESSVGRFKAELAVERLADLNPEIELVARVARLKLDNIKPLLTDHDVIVDGSDNYPTKYLLADASVRYGKPLVYGSVTGMDAMVGVFDARRGPCLRCLFPQAPRGWVPNCAEAGVLGPLVGMAGAMQAAETIKLLLADHNPGIEPIIGRLWTMDARNGQSRLLNIAKRADCALCSGPAEAIDLSVHEVEHGLVEIEIAALEDHADRLLLDVREPHEFISGHLPGAVNLPLSALQAGSASLPEAGTRCVIYCHSGLRCREAAVLLRQQFDADVISLRGGYAAWSQISTPQESVR